MTLLEKIKQDVNDLTETKTSISYEAQLRALNTIQELTEMDFAEPLEYIDEIQVRYLDALKLMYYYKELIQKHVK